MDRQTGQLPWVEELAADIFEGRFSTKFAHAARIAGELLTGSLYERYYGLDYADLAVRLRGSGRLTGADEFGRLCRDRAHDCGDGGWSVAANRMIIEQAQVVTTHNLATLVGRVGIQPAAGWSDLARRAFDTVLRLARRLEHSPYPLPVVKDIAYAWRQMIFFASLSDADDPATFVDEL